MSPLRRAAITAAILGSAVLLALVLRTLDAMGVFDSVQPGFSGTCQAIGGIAGAEDLQIDARDKLVFLSATDRHAAHGDPRDGIYTMALDHPQNGVTKLGGAPRDFHPHGISLYRDALGGLTLMAIDHRGDGSQSVEIFDVLVAGGKARLVSRGSVSGGLLRHPNDIAATGRDTFYVTNDHGSLTKAGLALEQFALLPRANVLYFDGNVFRVVADGLNFANGIQVSPDGRHVYVATTTGRALFTYERNPFSGDLKQVGTLSIASGLDNIDIDAHGNLWVAGHPGLLELERFQKDASRRAASEVFKVTMAGGIPKAAMPVYTGLGARIGGASVAALSGGHLIIGSGLDDRVLDCTLK